MLHDSHPAIVRRLRRADGQLQAIIKMIEQGRSCVYIAQQLQAVESAIDNTKIAPIHTVVPRGKAPRRTAEQQLSPPQVDQVTGVGNFDVVSRGASRCRTDTAGNGASRSFVHDGFAAS